MNTNFIFGGQTITNPIAKFFIAMLVVLLVMALLFFVFLFVGVTITLTLGFVGLLLIALAVGIPMLLFGSLILTIVLAPFSLLRNWLRRR